MRGFVAGLVALAGSASAFAAAAEKPRVVVVKSQDLSAYSSVVAGFTSEVHAQVTEITLPDNPDAQAQALKQLADAPPAMVLALGPAAANGAKRSLTTVPVVFCMVPYYEKYGLEGPNVTGIALTNDTSTELDTLKAVAPDLHRVGVLYDPRYSLKVVDEAQAVATQNGMTIVPLESEGASGVDRALKGARGKVDALMMIADKTVANATVVRKLIAFAQDARVPLIGLSPSQVKEGALLSLSPSYTGIGQQAGRLANRIIHERVDPGALAVAPPETLDLAVNLGTAKKLGPACDLALDIFRFAARRNYSIKVFE